MKSTMKGAAALAVMLLIALLHPPLARGQLSVHSGALKKAEVVQHSKQLERRIFQLTNEARRKNHLSSLALDATLTATARQKSDDMLKRHYFSHTSPDGKTIVDRLREEEPAKVRSISRAGENIYMSSKLDSSDTKAMALVIVDTWMTSPGHRANILNPDYSDLGVGVSVMGKELMATQNFAAKKQP
jgi:uncharacterized protein YkwD